MDKEIKTLKYVIPNSNNINIYRDNDNNIIIDGDIIMYDTDLTKFPVKIYKVNGNIYWYGHLSGIKYGTLETLENFPDIVTGSVLIYKNPKLTSLKYCPKYIGGSLQCDRCNISDISDISEYIGQNLILSYNPIKNYDILEKIHIGNILNVLGNNINKQDFNLNKDSSLIICNILQYS